MKNFFILINFAVILSPLHLYSQIGNVTFVNTGATTIYDLASNSTPQWIAQDLAFPDNIHIVIMSSPLGDPSTFTNRRTKYYFSTNWGVSWDYIGDVNSRKSGFPSVMISSEGNSFVCDHSSTTTNAMTRVLLYYDAAPGLGSFTLFDPPTSASNYFFGRFCLTSNITLPVKFVAMGQNMTSDTTFRITGNNPWSTWTAFTNTSPEAYFAARGTDGRIGIVYIQNSFSPNDYKGIYIIESTDNGLNFSTPLKIFSTDFTNVTTDSLAAFRGLSMTYKGTAPLVTFETVKQNPVTGSYDMQAPAKIRFWSSELPGSDPYKSIIIASKENVPVPSADSIKTDVNDQFGTLSRPAIGVSEFGESIFIIFQVFTNKWSGVEETNYKALYLTYAYENSYIFHTPVLITPTNPLMDWSFPSISPVNKDENSVWKIANICALSDSVPGTYVNGTDNGQSLAKLYYIKVPIADPIGIKNENEVSSDYSLGQNFPNPFNSETSIRFKIAENTIKNQLVTLKVYDIKGSEVAVLVNNYLQPGTYKINFDAGNLNSGIYFYRLTTSKFTETKKLILLK